MTLMAMYAIEWEKRAREEQERQVKAEWARWSHLLQSASEAKQPQERSQRKASAFGRLWAALGHAAS